MNEAQTDTRINAELVRFWLEEGQELEVVNDAKYEKLNEVVEDIDNINRALRMCVTVQEIDQLDKQENKGKLIDVEHLVNAAKQRISRGDVQKRTASTLSPLDFLANLRGRLNDEPKSKKCSASSRVAGSKKNDADDDATMGSDIGEDEDDEDLDLVEEKPDDEEPAEGEKIKKKKASGKKAKATDEAPVKKPLLMGGGGLKNKFA